MLLARPVLEEWQAIQDYANGKLRLGEDGKWIEPERTKNGHYLLKLVNTSMADEEQAYSAQEFEELYVATPVLMQPGEHPDDLLDHNVGITPSETHIDQAECAAVLESFKEAMDDASAGRKPFGSSTLTVEISVRKWPRRFPALRCQPSACLSGI